MASPVLNSTEDYIVHNTGKYVNMPLLLHRNYASLTHRLPHNAKQYFDNVKRKTTGTVNSTKCKIPNRSAKSASLLSAQYGVVTIVSTYGPSTFELHRINPQV